MLDCCEYEPGHAVLECSFVCVLPYGFIQSALVSAHFFSGLVFRSICPIEIFVAEFLDQV